MLTSALLGSIDRLSRFHVHSNDCIVCGADFSNLVMKQSNQLLLHVCVCVCVCVCVLMYISIGWHIEKNNLLGGPLEKKVVYIIPWPPDKLYGWSTHYSFMLALCEHQSLWSNLPKATPTTDPVQFHEMSVQWYSCPRELSLSVCRQLTVVDSSSH